MLKQIWKWLDGKKTAIGAIVSLGTAYGVTKGWIGLEEQTLFLGISTILVGIGLGDKARKAIVEK